VNEDEVAEGSAIPPPPATIPAATPLVEAQRAIRTESGELFLVAAAPATPKTFGPNSCQSD